MIGSGTLRPAPPEPLIRPQCLRSKVDASCTMRAQTMFFALQRRTRVTAARAFGVAVTLLGLHAMPSHAASPEDDLFRARYEIGAITDVQRGTNNITQLDRLFSESVLEEITDGDYDPSTTEVATNVDFRGVPALAGFRQGETAFYFIVDAAGINIEVDAGDRDASVEEFQSWLKGGVDTPSSPEEAVTSLFQSFIADSAVDPVAGNPYSLQTQMMSSTYDTTMRSAFRPSEDDAVDAEGRPWTGEDVFRMRADYSPYWADIWNGFAADLAFDYTLNLREPRLAFVFDLPIMYAQTESSAHTIMVHAGVGVLYRATPWWNIMTQGRVGVAGSLQLGALGVLYSTNTTSQMQWRLGRSTLRIGNAFSMSSSVDGIEWLGYELTYAITNYLVRNGFEVDHALAGHLFGDPLFLRLSFNDNWLPGSDLYVDHYDEVGLHMGTTRSLGGGSTRDGASIGLVYTGAQGYHALRVSLGMEF